MQQTYGAVNNKYHKPGSVVKLYEFSRPFPEDSKLKQIEATQEYMPHLATWAPVALGREGKVSFGRIIRTMSKYLGNMSPEEVSMIAPMIAHIARTYEINAIDTFDECAIIHCHINDEPYSCVITVMNLIEDNAHWLCRDTLN